ncbi:MAG: SIMPL domain-containing protein [Gemmatimonadota bacterium]
MTETTGAGGRPRRGWWAVVLGSALAAGAMAMAGCGGDTVVNPAGSALEENTIHVSGSATVRLAPDVAQTQLAVQTFAPAVTDAVTDNNLRSAAVIAAVKGLGVADADIETVGFSVSPQRDYQNSRPDSVVGYWVYNNVAVTIRQLGTAGQVLQAAIDAGANSVSGLAFTLGDPEPVKDQARALAVADARSRAETLAAAAGVEVGRVLYLSETSLSYPPLYRSSAADAAGGAVPVEPGEMEVTAQVQVVFAIK